MHVPFFPRRARNLRLSEKLIWKPTDNKGFKQQSWEDNFFSKSKGSCTDINFSQQAEQLWSFIWLRYLREPPGEHNLTTMLISKEKRRQQDAILTPKKRFQPSIRKLFPDNLKAIIRRDWEQFKDQKSVFPADSKLKKNHFSLKKPNTTKQKGLKTACTQIILSWIHVSEHCGSFVTFAAHTTLPTSQLEVTEVGQQNPRKIEGSFSAS